MRESFDETAAVDPCGWPTRPVPVGLVTTDHEIWVVVAPRLDVTHGGEIDRPAARSPLRSMRICREVLTDGRVRIGRIDPRRDRTLAEFLGGV